MVSPLEAVALRQAEQRLAIEKIHEIAVLFRNGQMSYQRAATQIEEILNGDASRVVRVGRIHQPEVET